MGMGAVDATTPGNNNPPTDSSEEPIFMYATGIIHHWSLPERQRRPAFRLKGLINNARLLRIFSPFLSPFLIIFPEVF